jgi:hypothetical protein
VAEEQCSAPPGWFLPDDSSSDMQECPSGTYKEVRAVASAAAAAAAMCLLSNTAVVCHGATLSCCRGLAQPGSATHLLSCNSRDSRPCFCAPTLVASPICCHHTCSLLVSAACTLPLLQGWNRAATCTPCGEGPWLSDWASSIDILDPNTGNIAEIRRVRGTPDSCLIQQGMGVTKLSSSGVLQAVICPVNFLGSSDTRHGLAVAPCAACPKLTVTAGNDGRALSYNNTAGEAVAISEGGYYSVTACVTPPGYGYYADGAQECPQGYFNEGGNLLPCTQCVSRAELDRQWCLLPATGSNYIDWTAVDSA